MSQREIILYGNPLLREHALSIEAMTPEIEALVESMAESMYANCGVGLAAPQIGELRRLFVVDVDQVEETESGRPAPRRLQVFINPEIVEETEDDVSVQEGCLSFPGIFGDVYRPSRVKIRARDENFEPFELETEGLLARAVQHELDHLNGVLFIDRMGRLARTKLTGKLAGVRRRGRAQAETSV